MADPMHADLIAAATRYAAGKTAEGRAACMRIVDTYGAVAPIHALQTMDRSGQGMQGVAGFFGIAS